MRTAVIEIVFPEADVNQIPTGVFNDANQIAEIWGGTVITAVEVPTTDQQKEMYEEVKKAS